MARPALLLLVALLAGVGVYSSYAIDVNCKSPRDPWVQVENLVGYWPLDVDNRDYSGGLNHLKTPVHSTAKKPARKATGGPRGQGFVSFDNDGGVASVLATPYDARTPTGSYTFEFWFRVTGASSDSANWFLSYAVPSYSNELFMSTGNGNGNTGKCDAGRHGHVEGETADCAVEDPVVWKHMAYVFNAEDGTRSYLYIDGVETGSKTNTELISDAGTLAIGVELDSSSWPDLKLDLKQALIGDMAEVRHWNRSMSATEIAALRDETYTCVSYDIPRVCTVEEENLCHPLAYCDKVEDDNAVKPKCTCPVGLYGDGFGQLGCHDEVPSLACDDADENIISDDGRRSGVVIGGATNLAGYWPLSQSGQFRDRSGHGHDMAALNGEGPYVVQTDAGSPFIDGYAEFNPGSRARSDLDAILIQDFNPQLVRTGGSYTWEFWMRVDESDGTDSSFNTMWFISYAVGNRGESDKIDNEFFMSTGHGSQFTCDGGLHGEVQGSAEVCAPGNGWHHVAFVHDASDANDPRGILYIDGIVQNDREYTKGAMRCQEKSYAECADGNGGTLMFGGELDGLDPADETNNHIRETSQFLHGAMTEVRYWTEARSQQQILDLMNFRLESLHCGKYVSGPACTEQQSKQCHYLANCENIDNTATCFCEMGMIGTGSVADPCRPTGWTVRTVYESVSAANLVWLSDNAHVEARVESFKACFGSDAVHFQRGVSPFSDAIHFPYASHALMVNALFDEEPTDEAVAEMAANAANCFTKGVIGATGTRKYKWEYSTTAQEQMIPPTGLTVDAVSFETSCAESGCWVIDVTYTTGGKDAFNSFYLPHAVGNDTISYDFPYDDITTNSFQPAKFPCRTHQYILPDGTVPDSLPDQVTSCCLLENYTATDATDTANGFVNDYRPTNAFVEWVDEMRPFLCKGRDFPYVAVVDRADYDETEGNPNSFIDVNFPWHSTVPHRFLDGKFKGMPDSPGVVSTTTLDPFFYQYKATIKLDEVELRQLAGLLTGTVGVEYTVDTFLGYVNFRPTGLPVIDSFATQQNLHLEKTSFFSVSTHGTNDYTFLEYVNLRLISIYDEDPDFSGTDESADRTVRTDSTGNANYIQVTFTVGTQYSPNNESGGLIPLDSVRAGRGTFFGETTMTHLCSMYTEGGDSDDIGLAGLTGEIGTFDGLVEQGCGPQSSMCVSPSAIPDQFVSFNIPLGFGVFDNQASSTLQNNIFVSMVINALDETGCDAPNSGCAPLQVKTTLDASIPIVDGGVNIFCDGVTAKTDLKDVANADIIVGSASSPEELTRLRILANVANTDLGSVPSSQIDTDSIESALMTLVLEGNTEYFTNGQVNSQGYSLELDDLITIHLMTDGEAPSETDAECAAASAESKSKDCQVRELLAAPPADNTDSDGLVTEGYALNGAFRFDVDRGLGIAKLEPTTGLLGICPFNPPRPSGGMVMESCITRRDVRSRTYPWRGGAAGPTAMEILAQTGALTDDDLTAEVTTLEGQAAPNTCGCTEGGSCCESAFLQTILGDNTDARDLAVDFVKAIHDKYTLNGRYTRAFWINPGYEWTPTQTSGRSLFSVSQKLYLFALITLDENIARRSIPHRLLLSTSVDPTAESGSGVGATSATFPVERTSIMATAFNVPKDKVGVFDVDMSLTQAEACMSDTLLVESLLATFADYLSTTASTFHTVQVLGFTRELNGEQCSRRNVRQLLSSFSAATASVRMMIVYTDKGDAMFNDVAFAEMPGIAGVTADPSNAPVIKVDSVYKNTNPGPPEDSESSTALIAGIAGGIGGAILLAAGGVLWMRSRTRANADQTASVVQTINVADLKAQISAEV